MVQRENAFMTFYECCLQEYQEYQDHRHKVASTFTGYMRDKNSMVKILLKLQELD